jgi:mannosyltransferase
VAGFVFLWQLGSSSFFIDEAASMKLAATPFTHLLTKLKVAENSPAGYFAILHIWNAVTGSDAEWLARLPSALAGLALVLAVYRLGVLVNGGKGVALLGAVLIALSPLALEYAQQARPYMLTMLALTLGAIGAIEAERRTSWGWLGLGAAAFAVALSMHYGALAVVAPFSVWMLSRRTTPLRMRLVFCAVPAIAWVAWVPLAIAQRDDHPGEQLGQYGTFTAGHAVRVVAAPFDDRYSTHPGVLKALAAVVVAVAVGSVAISAWRAGRDELLLMAVVVLLPMLALLAGSAAGVDILNSRYMTFAVPFMAILLASAIVRAPRTLGVAGLTILLVTAVVFDVGSHRRSSFYPDTRGVVDTIAMQWRPGDAVVRDATLGVLFPLAWYAGKRLPGVRILAAGAAGLNRSLTGHPRLWIVREADLGGGSPATPPGYHAVSTRNFVGDVDIILKLALVNR